MNSVIEVLQNLYQNNYFKFLVILSVTLIVAFLTKIISRSIFKPLAQRTKTKIDDIIVKNLSSIIFYLILFLGVKFGLESFEIQTPVYRNIIDTFLILLIALFLIKILDGFAKQWMKEWKFKTKTSADERLIPLLQKITKAVIIILAAFFIFSSWNVDISPLLATAGIAGLAIGLAVKDSLANMLGGLQLVLDKAFKVGDKVEIESGELGVILDIGLRSTKLKTYDNEVIYIPNGYLANAKIKNFTQPDLTMRVNVEFGVEYGSDTEKVREVVIEAANSVDTILPEPEPIVQFLKMSDFSLDFVARAWVENYSQAYSSWVKLTDAIYNALNEANIGIPFPTRTVYTKTLE